MGMILANAGAARECLRRRCGHLGHAGLVVHFLAHGGHQRLDGGGAIVRGSADGSPRRNRMSASSCAVSSVESHVDPAGAGPLRAGSSGSSATSTSPRARMRISLWGLSMTSTCAVLPNPSTKGRAGPGKSRFPVENLLLNRRSAATGAGTEWCNWLGWCIGTWFRE